MITRSLESVLRCASYGVAFLVCCGPAMAQMGKPVGPDKKLIAFATSSHVAEVEKRLPLDGLILFIYHNSWAKEAEEGKRARGSGIKNGLECMLFGGRKFTRDDFTTDLADLKATAFSQFTDNFILLQTSARGSVVTGNPGDGNLDWFDPAWDGIAQNGAIVAKLAKDAGFKGIMLDVEDYQGSLGPWQGKHIFDYEVYPYKDKHTREQFAAQMQLRGRQFMKAVVEAYPDITIIMIQSTGWGRENQLGSFVRGMLEARGNATLIDDLEMGYQKVTPRPGTPAPHTVKSNFLSVIGQEHCIVPSDKRSIACLHISCVACRGRHFGAGGGRRTGGALVEAAEAGIHVGSMGSQSRGQE